jgi:superfamily II DNA or RNA helicase
MNTENRYISKYGYVLLKDSLETSEIIELKKKLVAKPIVSSVSVFGNPKDTSFSVFRETKTKLYIPKFYGIEKYGMPRKIMKNYYGSLWETWDDNHDQITFNGNLYDRQLEPRDTLLESCKTKGGGILNIATGLGKTTIALNVITKLKKTTLVIVNKISLLNQWQDEISKFIPNAKVGKIQGQKMDIENKHIIIAMLQSLSKIDYPQEIFTDIGLVIVDECHNTSTKMFSQIFFKLCSEYTIGLSATPERSDGCEYVFKWHLGEVSCSLKQERRGNVPILNFVKINSSNYNEIKTMNNFTNREQIQFTSMISDLVEMKDRNRLIVEIIQKLVKQDRKVLLMSDRRNHIQSIYQLLCDLDCTFTFGKFMGSMKKKDLDVTKECQVILATFSAFSEGVSVYDLDTLVLATPKKYIDNDSLKDSMQKKDNGKMQQIIGRIFRKDHIDTTPMIVDLCDNFSVYKYQATTRKKFYKKNLETYTIKNTTVDIDKEVLEIDKLL